jgi:hypothetical protein
MKTKTFDAVELMRTLRDTLSAEMQGMTPEERTRYLRDKADSSGLGPGRRRDKGEHAGTTETDD